MAAEVTARAGELKALHVPAGGLDVHKDMMEACVIDSEGTKHKRTFETMRKSLYALRDWLVSLKCFQVLMESTSVYWIPIFEILEDVQGMVVGVGNARNMKQVPGRPKTDKTDADWIARLRMLGLILKSFVIGRRFRELREYTRYHKKLVQERARQVNRIEKLPQTNGFKLSSVLSDITGASGMKLLRLLCDKGSVTVDEARQSVHRRVKKQPEEIERAINGTMKRGSRVLLGRMLSKLAASEKEIAEIYAIMSQMIKDQGHDAQIKLISSMPGLGELSAIYILAEISSDLSSFPSANHFAAWAGLAPKDVEGAGKLKRSKTQKANIYVRSVLTECAWAATRTRNTRISNWYWGNVGRLGDKKAITGVARKLLVCIHALMTSGEMYDDSLDAADTEKRKAEKLESARKIVEHRSNTSDTVAALHQGTVQDIPGSDHGHPPANAGRPCPGDDGKQAPPKRKGRPKTTAAMPEVAGGEVAKPLKRRGRPRKVTESEVSSKLENKSA